MNYGHHIFWYDAYQFEVYTRHPEDRQETGWRILRGTVHGATREEAEQALADAFGPYWDCVITLDKTSPYGDGLHINDTKAALRALMVEHVEHYRILASNLAAMVCQQAI